MATVRGSAPPATQVLERAFAPLHKRALGLAFGLTAGFVVFLVTAFHVVAQPVDGIPIGLLSQYFYGYHVSWGGAFVGFWWALVAGFAAGWFVAFLRNLAVAIWIFWIRAKATFAQTSDFLDHI
jgi:hypothetical protein